MGSLRALMLLLLAVLPPAVSGLDAELLKIREQSVAFFLALNEHASAKAELATQKQDGSWADIDYKDKGRSHWKPRLHLERLGRIACAYADSNASLYRKPEARDAVLRGLELWVMQDPQSQNWWNQQIGTPLRLFKIMLPLGDGLPQELSEKIRPLLDRSKPGMTGQNKVWLAGIHLHKGILYNQPEWVRKGRDLIAEELRIAAPRAEGLQSDWSYHQHGAQLQFGNYGLAYFTDMTQWVSILAGTQYALPPEKTVLLEHFYSNGLRWVMFNGQFDFNASGRQILQTNIDAKYNNALRAVNALNRALENKKPPVSIKDFTFSGSRYFYKSDFYVHRTKDVYYSVRMSSKRINGSETVNAENLLGRLTGHGLTVMQTPRGELRNIGALWNWRTIPGVTSLQDDSKLDCRGPGQRNSKEWVGGLSDGVVGFCAMDFDNGELKAKKSYFFAGQTMLCVGSRISSERPEAIYTSVAQHNAGSEALEWNSERNQVRQGNFRYRLLDVPEVRCDIREATGSWKQVVAAASGEPEKGTLFTLLLDHGTRPVNARYAYSVEYHTGDTESLVLLKTTSDAIHAVAIGDAVMAVFYESGAATLPDGSQLISEQPALLMLRQGKLYAADPGQNKKNLDITLNDRKIQIALPELQLAGSTTSTSPH